MGRARTIARRSFLVGSLAIGGGVAFGIYRYKTPYKNPLLAKLPPDAAALTPYVLITAEGITLITPHADKGQGAFHLQALLIAEELDVTLDQIKTDPGQPAAAYWNQALSEEAAAFLSPGQGLLNSATHTVADAMVKFTGMQITGGSTTVTDGFVKLRQAGASARETLKRAAAQKTGVALTDLTTRDGAVVLPDGTALPYTELAAQAAGLAPSQDVPLRAPSEWRLIGKETQRLDIVPKSTGTQSYGIDISLPDMVYATVLLAPHGSQLESYDAANALQMPGVQSIVEVQGGLGIVADNSWRAFQAALEVDAKWTRSTQPATMEDHWQALSDAFTDDQRDSRKRDDGDIETAQADHDVIELEMRAPYLAHAPLEPRNATVLITDQTVDIWTGTQIPQFLVNKVSALTGIPLDQITLHNQMIGGSFGLRLEDDVVRQATEIAMQMKGTPVKLTYSRETDFSQNYPRQISMARVKGTVKDGHVESYDLDISMPSIMASQMKRQGMSVPGADSQIVSGAWDQPFAIPHARVTGYRATGVMPVSSWRSVGASTGGFFYNAGLDRLIHAAGADPMAERLRLCDNDLARNVLETVAEMSQWAGPTPSANKGRGVALTYSFGVHCAEVIEVTNTDDGITIDKVWVAAEVGRVVDPVNFENNVMGGVIFGLSHAMNCEMTYEDGVAQQENYYDYEGMRLRQSPEIMVRALEMGDAVRGIGEPPLPPAAPALASAIFAATGIWLDEMPFSNHVNFA